MRHRKFNESDEIFVFTFARLSAVAEQRCTKISERINMLNARVALVVYVLETKNEHLFSFRSTYFHLTMCESLASQVKKKMPRLADETMIQKKT